MDTTESSAPHAHPPTGEPPRRDHQDDVEAHYSGLERLRPHACNDGWITVGQIVVDSEMGEYALYLCRGCAVRS